MTEERPRVWVGDQVHDANADREGIVTDVKGGTYVLRPVYMWSGTWTAPSDKGLEVTVSREERLRLRREEA
ncbi:hypothetical protein [Streptomyces fulvoviolaceus]|uniref:hypothetical protein n=1 Tax=Streptomyces fulvoviolaceus TaxID=285535 RepID=UPI0021BFC38B|nr:hypothetical protein [Streptomyces fulvoviolaceus]MCT9077890.1 hypothetical protein [Streptomyces fulvoviolaceus]